MSLFPAYKPSTSKGDEGDGSSEPFDNSNTHQTNLLWLSNTSYTAEWKESNYVTKDSDNKKECTTSKNECKTDYIKSRNKKKKKDDKREKLSRHKKTSSSLQKPSLSSESYRDEQFYEDKNLEKGNFLVDTLYRPAIPRYDKCSHYFKIYKIMRKTLKRNKKPKRYFALSLNKNETTCDSSDEACLKEDDLTKITEDLNKRLTDNPKDIETWLEYIRFQDTVLEFEKAYRSNPTTVGGEKIMTERKLAILDRALQSNPASEDLLAAKLALLERLRPADQLAEECSRMLVQDPGCVPLWRALVRTSRNNMARCVAPAVLQVFSRAISRLGQLRVHRPPATIDKDILALVLECGLFLQQAGLWEQLFMLLQMYLGLNLTASGQIAVPAQTQEEKLREQEDTVVASGLPLSVMWLRVEKLRAAYHYQPLADCESDPQRVVFSDDLAGVLQPVMSSELRLRLVASVFVLLKLPVLPTRHTTLECLGLLQIPSSINNAEAILAAVYPVGFSALCDCRYQTGCVELVSEPQLVKEGPGQLQFLSTCTWLMQHCAELLPMADAVIVHAWLLRLYGLLCRLQTLHLATMPLAVVKQARSHAKQLLKMPQFRENLWLYSEYAMVEKDAGDLDRGCKILETALALPLPSATGGEPDVYRLLLCRRLVECLLIKDFTANKESALRVLMSVLASKPVMSCEAPVSSVVLQQCAARLHHCTTALSERLCPLSSKPLTLAAALSPQLLVEWLACHALFLSLTHSVWDATALLQQHIDSIPHISRTNVGSAWVEQLYEVLTGLLCLHTTQSRTSFSILRSTIVKALKSYPNNLTLLNTLACLETSSGGGGSPMWKLTSYFPSSAPLARLVLVFVVRYRISQHAKEDTSISAMGSHYLRSLLRQLTGEGETRECPLMWRLYLQLVAATDTAPQIKATFYKALQACPWIKALYLDAVKFLPEELPEVQDLLIEKELRLHTTPEELEILRD